MFSRYFNTSSAAFDEQKVVHQLRVSVCLSVSWSIVSSDKGQAGNTSRGGRKTLAVGGGLVEGMLERQQWVVDEELEDS